MKINLVKTGSCEDTRPAAAMLTLWPVKDCGVTNQSTDTKLDAGDELRIPLKPLLAIACVGNWHYFITNSIEFIYYHFRYLRQYIILNIYLQEKKCVLFYFFEICTSKPFAKQPLACRIKMYGISTMDKIICFYYR